VKYYKHPKTNEVFAYESEQERDQWGSPSLIQMTREEVARHLSKGVSGDHPDPGVSERVWRDAELARADVELFKVQDSDPKAVGSVADWRQYRKELRAWPEHEGFPSKANRPKAPDAV